MNEVLFNHFGVAGSVLDSKQKPNQSGRPAGETGGNWFPKSQSLGNQNFSVNTFLIVSSF